MPVNQSLIRLTMNFGFIYLVHWNFFCDIWWKPYDFQFTLYSTCRPAKIFNIWLIDSSIRVIQWIVFSGRHKFSVIFGVGSRKYRTCVVKDPNGCPEWNEESVMYVKYILKKDFCLEGFTGTFQLLFVVKGYIWVSIM